MRGGADPRSANQSPQSVGSSGMDSGVDSFSDQLGDLPHIAISLCGGLSENREITKGKRRSCDVYFNIFLYCHLLIKKKKKDFY